jgi:hypothetical protein
MESSSHSVFFFCWHAQAAYDLGLLSRGAGNIPKNKAEALKWLRLSAEQGCGSAQGFPVPAEYLSPEGVKRLGRGG